MDEGAAQKQHDDEPGDVCEGAVIPASEITNCVKNRAAIAGEMWVIACMVAPSRPIWSSSRPLFNGDAEALG